jgi:glycosyltransferase involved in cell wall biosynthesis
MLYRKMISIWLLSFIFIVGLHGIVPKTFDLSIVGVANHTGIGQISLGLIENLKDELNINYIYPLPPSLIDVSEETKSILLSEDKTPGNVCILTVPLSICNHDFSNDMPESKIKIAYSVLECTKIPLEWVKILNEKFDAVVVPDKFLVEVYQNSGVLITIFDLPQGMDLDPFLKKPTKLSAHKPFVFGSTLGLINRKNYSLLIQAFTSEFGNSSDVILKINGPYKSGNEPKKLQKLISSLKVKNVFLTQKNFDNLSYLSFVNEFDCYINLSKGEGFSLCPREALALGIPCILTNNSAQMTICDSGFVRAVPSDIYEPADYDGIFGDQDLGFYRNCTIEDARSALRDVYNNYAYYLNLATQAREWVKQYRWKDLKPRYINLIKPKQVIFGDKNIITDEYLMTNSSKLYQKYLALQEKNYEDNIAFEVEMK